MRFSFSFAHGEAAEISVEVSRHVFIERGER